ncbi:DNA-directed RNA polymerase subunit beta' [bacterium]|nr:MAG: DNA-directed RNA polymerase subunit beta' [bacterium]
MADNTNSREKNEIAFAGVKVKLASPDIIRSWSFGEVTKPETINYRTFKPEKGGLFCERIFGPVKDWECSCGKYKGIRYKGVVCDRCGVEITRSRVRRDRMGHIELAVPVTHIWYIRSHPSRVGRLLDLSIPNLEEIIYYESYVVIDPGDEEITGLKKCQLLTEDEYRKLKSNDVEFVAGMGATALYDLLAELDMNELVKELRAQISIETSVQRKKTLLKRLEVAESFRQSENRPEWMILKIIPVIPPDLRPLVPLEGGRFATSDLNDLYRRLINRNNRLKKLIDIQAPEVILRNEKRMLQEAVDALMDNSRQGSAIRGKSRRPLKSLSDLLKGKQGRFRQNLLGKRVDYSGRSVIVVGPELKLYECGLPKSMALELFKPFILRKLEEKGFTQTVKSAKKFVEKEKPEIWDLLEEIIENHPVLLNRAPTLHRLGIQAFYPKLVEGKAIQIHPLVCSAFNADFDGDQMPVHVPLSFEAQMEAHKLMLAPNNILLPANGKPVASPSQDMVLGCYYLTKTKPGEPGEKTVFSSPDEVVVAYDHGKVGLHAQIAVRIHPQDEHLFFKDGDSVKAGDLIARIPRFSPDPTKPSPNKPIEIIASRAGVIKYEDYDKEAGILHAQLVSASGETVLAYIDIPGAIIWTTVGRVLFNEAIPEGLPFYNEVMKKKVINDLVALCYKKKGLKDTAIFLDELKTFGFEFATQAAVSIGIDDLVVPDEKQEMIMRARKDVEKVQKARMKGLVTEGERYNKVIDIWNRMQEDVTDALHHTLLKTDYGFNALAMMVDSGARGSQDQIRQLAGMRGLMSKPQKRLTGQEIIETPILSNFKEGLSVLEYFISTHGQRKGLADTALKTADAGYLTRRLVDVAQDVIITMKDCGTIRGVERSALKEGEDIVIPLRERIAGRIAAEDIYDPVTEKVIIEAGDEISDEKALEIEDCGIEKVPIRSVLTCEARHGVCAKCYGRDLAFNRDVEIGEAVGIIAGESIGEPGTQLTLRTFHIGGTASRITEQSQVTSRYGGLVEFHHIKIIKDPEKSSEGVVLNRTGEIVVTDDAGIEHTFKVPYGAKLYVKHKSKIKPGTMLYEWEPYINPILSDVSGTVEYVDVVKDRTAKEMVDDATMTKQLVIIDFRDRVYHPKIIIRDKNDKALASYSLPTDAHLLVEDGQKIEAGQPIAKLMRSISKTRDITGGLPRVAELFEARKPKEPAIISEIDGVVRFSEAKTRKMGIKIEVIGVDSPENLRGEVKEQLVEGEPTKIGRQFKVTLQKGELKIERKKRSRYKKIVVEPRHERDGSTVYEITNTRLVRVSPDGKEAFIETAPHVGREVYDYIIPRGRHILVQDNDKVRAGQKLCDGPIIPHDILRVLGDRAAQEYLLNEIQEVYRLQGVTINDKHIEVIVRQMLRKVRVDSPGDTRFLEDEQVDRGEFLEENRNVINQGGRPATFEPMLLGITRASLTTDSFISAASFQQTTRVLTEATVSGKVDKLCGLKENVIIGRLIPAGTGFNKYRKIQPKLEEPQADEDEAVREMFIETQPEEFFGF